MVEINNSAVARAEKAALQAEEARKAWLQLETDALLRDANTARLRRLRLERDRIEAEAKASDVPPAQVRSRRKARAGGLLS